MPLDQSEVIGSSIIARSTALIVGMEKRALVGENLSNCGNSHEIIVRHLKTWDKPFPPFSFTIGNDDTASRERMTVKFNLNPSLGDGKDAKVWEAIQEHYGDGSEFQRGYIEHICVGISSTYIKKLLGDWVKLGRLERYGSNRNTVYRVSSPLAGGNLLSSSPYSIDTTEFKPVTPTGHCQCPVDGVNGTASRETEAINTDEPTSGLYPESWDRIDEPDTTG
jgi:hypothetical protein